MTADTQTGTTANSSSGFNTNGELSTAAGPTIDNGATYNHATAGSDAGQLNTIKDGAGVTQETFVSNNEGAGVTQETFVSNNEGDRTSCTGKTGSTPCAGNTSSNSATYGYDEENRLISATDSSGDSDAFTYDGNSVLRTEVETIGGNCPFLPPSNRRGHRARPQRVRKATSYTQTRDLTWSTALGSPTLATTTDSSSCSAIGHADYVMGPNGEPVEQIYYDAQGLTYTPEYYYQDFQGNTRELLTQTATVAATYNEPPWGMATGSFRSSTETPLQYGGTYTDQWTGFVYDQARWYDPSTGQFMSQDPLVDQTLQAYAYAGDSPINSSDPSGMSANSPPACAGAAVKSPSPSMTQHMDAAPKTPFNGGSSKSSAAWVKFAYHVRMQNWDCNNFDMLQFHFWYRTAYHSNQSWTRGAKLTLTANFLETGSVTDYAWNYDLQLRRLRQRDHPSA
jgi:RHS repeat-associated protein